MKPIRLVVVAVLAAACSHARISDQAIDAERAKLDPAAVARIDASRGDVGLAQGEIAQAGQQVGLAREEHARGEADQKVAEAEEERVKKLVEAAEARRRAADAHHDYAEKLVEAGEAAEKVASCHAELADAKLELMKYEALEKASPASVAKVEKGDFLDRVAKSQRGFDDARERAAKLDAEAKSEQRKWQELAAKVPPLEQ